MRPLTQLVTIALVSGALMLILGVVAHDGAAELLATPVAWWGPAHLTTSLTTLAGAAGALGAAWHLASALLALTAGAASPGKDAPRRSPASRRLAMTVLQRWGAPLVRRVAAGAVVVGLTASPALAQDPAPSTDDLGWQPTTSRTVEADPPPAVPDDPTPQDVPEPADPTAPTPQDVAAPAPPASAPPGTPGTTPPAGTDQSESIHVVEAGESLWSITAATLGPQAGDAAIAAAWPSLYRANAEALGADPDLIHPGTALDLPAGLTDPGAGAPSR